MDIHIRKTLQNYFHGLRKASRLACTHSIWCDSYDQALWTLVGYLRALEDTNVISYKQHTILENALWRHQQ